MYLTNEEERIYNGESGWANQLSMRILVRLGELFNATKLIPIASAHVSGVSYKTLGDAPIDFLRSLARAKAKTKVRATLNPQSFDFEYLGTKLKPDLRSKQMSILRQFDKMGFVSSLTCTPYYLEKPKPDSHIAWAESSAVVYTNSVLHAWTNREGGPSALAAAIIGKTPDYGIHKTENRQPKITVKLDTEIKNETEFGALGILLGKILKDKIPFIEGLQDASESDLKHLGAALATTGMANMFLFKQRKPVRLIENTEKISVDAREIRRTVESLSTAPETKPDLVFLGCPHCSQDEMQRIAHLIGERRVKRGIEFWVCTSSCVKRNAREAVKKIEKCGGHVLAGVCTVVSWTEALGIKSIMTNSAKTAYYAPTLNKAATVFGSMKECLDAVLER